MSLKLEDYVVVSTSAAPAALSFMGVPLLQWMYLASIAASVFLVIERLPSVWRLMVKGFNYVRGK